MLKRFIAPLLAFTGVAWGQAGTATLNGTVTDSQGGVVPKAAIVATQENTNVRYETTTTSVGVYTIPALPIGSYRLAVEASGFKRGTRSGILLRVADNIRVDFQLDVGQVTEAVEVSSKAALVDASSATLDKVFESKRLVDLPLNGRNALSMVLLTPNVRTTTTEPQGFADRGDGLSSFSINGGPTGSNNITLDGLSNNNSRRNDANVNPAVDSVEEFKVQSGVISAEYGFTLGGVVNLVSKSGTNQFHGSLYEFVRNDKLNGRNTFATTAPPLRYNQFGTAVGGPIRRDRTFFFANFEHWILIQYYTATATTPTPAQRQGDFSQFRNATGALVPIYDPNTTVANPAGSGFVRNVFPGNIIPTGRLDPVALNIFKVYPLPNRTPTNLNTNANNFNGNFNTNQSAWQGTLKLDHRLSDANRLSGRYSYWRHFNDQASQSSPIFAYDYRTRNDDYFNFGLVVDDTHVFTPVLLNTIKAGIARQNFFALPGTTGKNPVSQFGLPNVPDIVPPIITITDSPAIPVFPRTAFSSPSHTAQYTLQFMDTVNWVRGRHSFKFGVDIHKNQFAQYLTASVSGTYNFTPRLTGNAQSPAGTGSGLASFALGSVASASIDSNVAVSYANTSQAYFVQDDIRLSKTLTLNLGFRYDYQQIPGERNNSISVFNGKAINPQNGLPGRLEYSGIDFQGPPMDPDYKNFAPRVGFAWDVTGAGTTVLRGGYGIYYPFILPITAGGNGYPSLGFTNNFTNYAPPGGNVDLPSFQLAKGLPTPPIEPLGSALGPSAFQSQNVSSIQRNFHTPYSQQFTLSLQRQLRGYLVEVAYSGNKGTHLAGGAYDANQLNPQYLSLGQSLLDQVPNPYAGRVSGVFGAATISRTQSLRPLPYYGTVGIVQPMGASSIYHSWLANVEKRFADGFVFLASYSFGKLISDGFAAAALGEQVVVNNFQSGLYNRRVERSLDPTDCASRFTFSGVYELPFGPGKQWKNSHGVVNRLIEGWQVNGNLVLQNGLPLAIQGANNNAANRPNSTGQSAEMPGHQRSLSQWFDTSVFVNPPSFTFGNVGRLLPDVRGPGIQNLDFSVLKTTAIRERVRVQFRAEAFNAMNHANYLLPGTTFTPNAQGRNANPNFGVITAARAPRIFQLALKVLF